MPKLTDPKEKDMFLSLKLTLMKNTVNGLMRSGSNGTRRNAKSGKRTPHHQVRICLGMSWRVAELQVLPDEILGWLLLRRANWSASSRLSAQASVQNSLSFRDIEMALSDQEEELLQADQQHHPHGKKRTFWGGGTRSMGPCQFS